MIEDVLREFDDSFKESSIHSYESECLIEPVKTFIKEALEKQALNILWDVSKELGYNYNSKRINEFKDKFVGEE